MSDAGYEPTRYDVPPVPGPGGVPPVGPGGGLPPDVPPPDNRPWIIGGLVALIIIIVVILLLMGGDDEDDVATDTSTSSTTSSLPQVTTSSTSSTTTTAAPATTVTTAAPTTTAAPATTSPPPVTVDPGDCADEGDNPANAAPAAEEVYDAWVRGDQACAAALMEDDAREELFANDGSGATFEFQGCGPAQDEEIEQDCAFFTEGTGLHFLMNFSDTEGWKVVDVVQTAD